MRTTAGLAERGPRRSRLDHPDLSPGSFGRGELAAGLAAAAVVAQLALAPVTLFIAGVLVLAGCITRWRVAWLLLPALGGACWLAIAGLPAAAHALTAGAGRLIAAELAIAAHPARLLHPASAFAGSGRWLRQELPLLVLAGTAEAAIALWPGPVLWPDAALWPGRFRRQRSGWHALAGAETPAGRRPGLVAVLRGCNARAALAAGHTVTASGCAIGLDFRSGRLAAISWAEAERGVLLTGGDPAELDRIGLAVACAAMRRRKTVLVLEASDAGALRGQVSCADGHVSCADGQVSCADGQVSCAGGHVSCVRDNTSCERDHVSCDPEVLAPVMPRSVVGGRMKRGWAAPPDPHGASVCAQVARLAERIGVPVTWIGSVADRAPVPGTAVVPGPEGVPGARTSGTVSRGGAFGRAIRRRSVVLVPAHQPEATQQAVGDLVGTLRSLRELGLRGDCLAWVIGCEAADVSSLCDLLALGQATGTAVVLSATSPRLSAELASEAGLVVASGPIAGDLAQRLADLAVGNGAMARGNPRLSAAESVSAKLVLTDTLQRQPRNSATEIGGSRTSGPVSFRIVPVPVTEVL